MRPALFVRPAARPLVITGPSGPRGTGHVLYTIDPVNGARLAGQLICAFRQNVRSSLMPTGRVQPYGQIVAAGGKAFALSPGVAATGTLASSPAATAARGRSDAGRPLTELSGPTWMSRRPWGRTAHVLGASVVNTRAGGRAA